MEKCTRDEQCPLHPHHRDGDHTTTYDRDTESLHTDRPDTIRTWTGKKVAPLDLKVDDVCIEDIAHALALQCRYNGHSQGHLSVARHSIWVSEILGLDKESTETQLWGLLHDAAEAYIGDMVRPLKQGAFAAPYLEAEARIERVIAKKFGLPYPMPACVHEADSYVLRTLEFGRNDDGSRYSWDNHWKGDERLFLKRFAALTKEVNPWIIGINGYAGAGKDTLGRVLVDHQGRVRLAFADVMRHALLELNPIVGHRIKGGGGLTAAWAEPVRLKALVEEHGWDAAKRDYPEVRKLLERFGTEAGRNVHGQDVWVNLTLGHLEPTERYVVTDVRFPNEAQSIVDKGGVVWRVNREGVGPGGDHASRKALDDWPFDRVFDVPTFGDVEYPTRWYEEQLGIGAPVDSTPA